MPASPETLEVLAGSRQWWCQQGDLLEFLPTLPEKSVDLIFGSPPYELARTYFENGKNLGIARKTEAWVAWMVEVFKASLRACKGLVAFVVNGQTKNYKWSSGPVLLMADLHRAGINLRKPPCYKRVGIPGSGGPDWLRDDYEFVVCATPEGRLPWSDNTACGHPPKWAPGGEMSHRLANGARVNQWGMRIAEDGGLTATSRGNDGGGDEVTINHRQRRPRKPSHVVVTRERPGTHSQVSTSYDPPTLANPGNVVECIVGGGLMGNRLCHENEAPFPEDLAEFFVRSFAPPNGVCLDPFAGSGTTLAVALRHGRRALGCDLRQSQVDLTGRRIAEELAPKPQKKERRQKVQKGERTLFDEEPE